MTRRISLLSPAKLNLFLHVTGQREDGYHELQTLFQLLHWGDQITLELADAGASHSRSSSMGCSSATILSSRRHAV